MKALMVAGTHSGSGKTTLSLALMAALRRRGLTVQAFKVGPDFIDPGHHALVTGRPSHNLDGWMLGIGESREIFARHAAGADVAVVEGVMGLYDGYDPKAEDGSSAQMAKALGLPVLLAADCRSMARSVAALAGGFAAFDPGVRFLGLAANRVGSPRHAEILAQAMELCPAMGFAGALVRNQGLTMPERHLGLVTAEEGGLDGPALERLADWVEDGLDLNALLARAEIPDPTPPAPAEPKPARVRLAVARDAAFCFYYAENLRRLEQAGAELAFFSPLAGEGLPQGANGLYLGGGYPELFAEQLAGCRLRAELPAVVAKGLTVYAECGGMMFLGRELSDLAGRRWPMAGVLGLATRMLPRLRSLGYREVTLTGSCPLGPAGTRARGHEFHYSELAGAPEGPGLGDGVYRAEGRLGPEPGTKGFLQGNLLASYVHLHLGSNPALAPALVDWMAAGHKGRQ